MATDPLSTDAPSPPLPRWPKVIGTIGVVLGVIMFVDRADDLLLLPLLWAGDTPLLLGPELGDFVARSMPSWIWLFFYILLGIFLGLLLVIGSLRLRHRSRSGITLCRAWAWLTIAWVAIALGGALWWLGEYGGEVSRHAGAGWEDAALSRGLLALALLLAYPVFLLVWFSRVPVKEEYLSWGDDPTPAPSVDHLSLP